MMITTTIFLAGRTMLTRFWRGVALVLAWPALGGADPPAVVAADASDRPPNVLFISVDDLNDWVGCFGGHPQVRTPHIDRLAERGVVFSNAHCAAPLCNPSRASVLSGLHPSQTGVFNNDDGDIRDVQPDVTLLPRHFKRAGYRTFGAGKLLHQNSGNLFDDGYFPHQRWSPFDPNEVNYTPEELPTKGTPQQRHVIHFKGRQFVLPLNRLPSDRMPDHPRGESFDWGPLPVEDDDMGDGKVAAWAVKKLRQQHSQPFFLAVGFYRPHIPLFAPQKYFDLYAGIDIELPPVKDDDLDDLSPTARRWALEAVTGGLHATVVEHDQWHDAVLGYLACVSFIDAQIGRLLEALDEGPHAEDTLIVLWSDHGWHLGEKQHWGKWTPWQRSTRVPLIVALPKPRGDASTGPRAAECREPVSLLDLYPTLIELCELPEVPGLAGQSLAPWLGRHLTSPATVAEDAADTDGTTEREVVTTFDRDNYALSGRRWRYIRYDDGSQELYDVDRDPNEWTNLAGDPRFAEVLAECDARLNRQLRAISQASGRHPAISQPKSN